VATATPTSLDEQSVPVTGIETRAPAAAATVAVRFVEILNTSDTKIDKSANDAGRRAATLAEENLAALMKAAPTQISEEWSLLAARHGTTTAEASLSQGVQPNANNRVQVTVVRTLHGDKKWTKTENPMDYMVTLAQHEGGWHVTNFQRI